MIGIDEGQFMVNLFPFCEQMVKLGKKVIIAALDGTFQRVPFKKSDVFNLIPRATRVEKLCAICFRCGGEAAFSRRIDTTNLKEESIGGTEDYVAACERCFEAPINGNDIIEHHRNLNRLKLLQSH